MQVPAATKVPENAMELRSASGTPGVVALVSLSTGTDSPVNDRHRLAGQRGFVDAKIA
jgi:hypothetical protein